MIYQHRDLIFGFDASSQVPILSSYIIPLHEFSEKIINVIDFQFLHGYYEPTILILYEPLPTWAGLVFNFFVALNCP
jgi:hypothetical protein